MQRQRWRMLVAGAIALSALGGVAHAQGAAAGGEERGYVQVLADATFGTASSQSYGAEAGITVRPGLQVYIEGGRANNAATGGFVTAAQLIAGAIGQTQTAVGFSAREPVAFGDAGVRYLVPITATSAQPYIMGGFGLAQVTQDAHFTVGGADVTNTLAQYGIVLGTDLSGRFTKPLLVIGGGVTLPVWSRLVVDLHYRYGRIFAADGGVNMSRAGIGVGVRF